MATQDIASKILKRLDTVTGEILQKYETLKKKQDIGMKEAISSVKEDFEKSSSDARASSRIALDNEMALLGEKGLSDSGIATQARMMNNMANLKTQSTLDSAKNRKISDIVTENKKKNLEIEGKKLDELMNAENSIYKSYYAQLQKDRDYEEKQKTKTSSSEKDNTIKNPSMSAANLLSGIVKSNTKESRLGYSVVNKEAVKQILEFIVKDKMYPYDYRYELSTYAKAQGYM